MIREKSVINISGSLIKILVFLLFVIRLNQATIWYVHPDSALNHIGTALSYCADNDTVLVASGTYYQFISWPNTQGIHLLSEDGAEATIIDAQNFINQVIIFQHTVDTITTIDGFTIKNGYNPYYGSGIYLQNGASPTIINNIISNNCTGEYGGGIYVQSSSPKILNNLITENISGHWGGGIAFRNQSSGVVANNTITYNRAEASGGGIFCIESDPVIRENIITINVGVLSGGGIACWDASPEISKNIITRNIANGYGGGLNLGWSSPIIDSCAITSNMSDGIYCYQGSEPTVHYNDLVDNVGYGIINVDSTVIINAEYNWWGDASGPGGAGPGTGEEVSTFVDYDPWLIEPGVKEKSETSTKHVMLNANILTGPLVIPQGEVCKIFDITGRQIHTLDPAPGIYFIEVDGKIKQKVIKIR